MFIERGGRMAPHGPDWHDYIDGHSDACASERFALQVRKGLNPVRTSFAKIIGSSHAAKCPPVSGLLK
ncbi:hypothetical protein PPGU19_044720 [Paraburkholderia sp. PGU19]|nr:hypothetical protein PPGU19_044720 [Paraburkholderia sp. PGU19]